MRGVSAGGLSPREACESVRADVESLHAELLAAGHAGYPTAWSVAVAIVAKRHGIKEERVAWAASPFTSLDGV